MDITSVVNDILNEIATDWTDHMFNVGNLDMVDERLSRVQVSTTYNECISRGWTVQMSIIETSRLHHSTFHLPNHSAWMY